MARGDSGSLVRWMRLADLVARTSQDSTLRAGAEIGRALSGAYLALLRRDTTGALERFNNLPDTVCFGCFEYRITRLFLRSARGEYRAVLDDMGPWTMLPSWAYVVGRLEQARVPERQGERERATRDYQYVVDAWRNADPEYQSYVAEARNALQGLTQEPPVTPRKTPNEQNEDNRRGAGKRAPMFVGA